MQKLREIKGEKALDVLADLLDPVCDIATDEELVSELQTGSKVKGVSLMLRNHKKSVLTIFAILNDTDPNTYEPNLIELPKTLLEAFNDPELVSLFILQGQSVEQTSSGSVTENTEASEE